MTQLLGFNNKGEMFVREAVTLSIIVMFSTWLKITATATLVCRPPKKVMH